MAFFTDRGLHPLKVLVRMGRIPAIVGNRSQFISLHIVADSRVITAFKAFPSPSRVTDGPSRPGESSSPLTVTRSCGIFTHFPFDLKHPGRVLKAEPMLTKAQE